MLSLTGLGLSAGIAALVVCLYQLLEAGLSPHVSLPGAVGVRFGFTTLGLLSLLALLLAALQRGVLRVAGRIEELVEDQRVGRALSLAFATLVLAITYFILSRPFIERGLDALWRWRLGTAAVLLVGGAIALALVRLVINRVRDYRLSPSWRALLLFLLGGIAIGLQYVNLTEFPHNYVALHALLSLSVLLVVQVMVQLWPGASVWLAYTSDGVVGKVVICVMALLAVIGTRTLVVDNEVRFVTIDRTSMLGPALETLLIAVKPPAADQLIRPLPAPGPRSPAPIPTSRASGPPIILITVDALRADRTRDGGAPRMYLPSLEQYSERSARFASAYAPSSWTGQSTAGMLSGRYPSRLNLTVVRTYPVPLHDRSPTLAEELRRRGYDPVTFANHWIVSPVSGITRGFDVRLGGFNLARPFRGKPSFSVETIADAIGVELERTRKAGKPLFLWAHLMDAHEPYRTSVSLPPGTDDRIRYDHALADVDRGLARALATVERLAPEAIVVISADHGDEFGDHGGEVHARTLYEEVIHVPLIVRYPGVVARKIEGAVSLVDLFPTLLELVDGKPLADSQHDGRSLVAQLRGEPPPPGRIVFSELDLAGRYSRAAVDGQAKLIRSIGFGFQELYDLKADPREQKNLAGQRLDLEARLAAALAGHLPPPRKP